MLTDCARRDRVLHFRNWQRRRKQLSAYARKHGYALLESHVMKEPVLQDNARHTEDQKQVAVSQEKKTVAFEHL